MGSKRRETPPREDGDEVQSPEVKIRRTVAGPFRLEVERDGSPPDASRDIARRYKRHLGAVSVGKRVVSDPDASVRIVSKRPAQPKSLSPVARPAVRLGGGLGLRLGRPADLADDDDDDDIT